MQLPEFQGSNYAGRNTRYRNSCTSFGFGLVPRTLAILLASGARDGETARARLLIGIRIYRATLSSSISSADEIIDVREYSGSVYSFIR